MDQNTTIKDLSWFKSLDQGVLLILALLRMHNNRPSAVTAKPKLTDIYEHFTPRYATQWRVIGTLLGLPSERLDIIEHDNRDKTEPCCNEMLKWWLRVDSTASWGKLFTVIESPAVSRDQAVDKGN